MNSQPEVMCIGGNFQLAEHARIFENVGVIYVQPNGPKKRSHRADAIRSKDNKYSLVTLNPNGVFDTSQIAVTEALALSVPEQRERFLEVAKNKDLKVISVGVSDGTLKDKPGAGIWYDLAEFLHKRTETGITSPLSILSSDNAFNNGRLLLNNLISATANNPYDSLGHNIDLDQSLRSNVYFHNCVVDTMVMGLPGAKALAHIEGLLKTGDPATIDDVLNVFVEPSPNVSRRLIIEDPNRVWGNIDAKDAITISTDSIFPYAVVKYEALNFFHTAQVHWGYVAGLLDVHANLQDDVLGAYVRNAAEAKAKIVSAYDFFAGTPIEVGAMSAEFTERCNNEFLGHQNMFIVRNGTGKIIERVRGSLVKTNGKVDNGMYGTIASIIREKSPIRVEQGEDGQDYIGEKDNGDTYKIEDTDPFIMQTMMGVPQMAPRGVIDIKVKEILKHVGLDGLNPKLQSGVTDLVYQLRRHPAMEVLQTYANKCFQ